MTEMPAGGEFQCTAMAATTPSAAYEPKPPVGLASGSAHMSFGTGGAAIQGTLQVSVGTESATLKRPAKIGDPAYVTMAGQLLSSGSGTALTLADQDSEAPALVMGYKAQLPSGASYIGVARFACAPL